MLKKYKFIIFNKTINCLFSCFISSFALGQEISMTGYTVDSVTQKYLPNINIFTKDLRVGTISTLDGNFSIKVPIEKKNEYLYFTGIGYQKDSIPIREGNFSVQLLPEVYQLREVYVMPDSTLLSLLRRAYNKIPDNYPEQPTFYYGFYRESIQNENRDQVDFVEAILGIYKEGYNKKSTEPGQIEIIKSRKKNIRNIGIVYYGGPYLAIDGDIVLAHVNYIVPQYFKDYIYQFNGIKTLNGRDFYEISFKKRQKDAADIFEGIMIIDKESLAYVSFDFISNHNTNSFRISDSQKNVKVFYERNVDKWYLKNYTYTNRHIDKLNNKERYATIEYMTIHIQKDSVTPISFEKRFGFTESIALKAEKYNKEGWTDYSVLTQNNLTQNNFQFSIEQSMDVFHNQHPTTRTKIRKNILSVLSKFNIGIGVIFKPVSLSAINSNLKFNPNKNNKFDINKNLNCSQETILSQFSAGYRINKNLNIFCQESLDLFDKSISSNELSLGFSWRKNIKDRGLPFFINASCVFNSRNYYVNLGKYNNLNSFYYKNKKFDAKTLNFNYGIEQYTISPQLALSKNITRLLEMKIHLAYHFSLHEKDVFQIEEKEGFIFSRKKVTISANNNDLQTENTPKLWESINLNKFQLGISFIFN